MVTNRKQHSAEFKFKVALQAAKEQQTIAQVAREQRVHPNQISRWKQPLLQEGKTLFSDKRRRDESGEQTRREAELYEQIGRLKMELDWLKKKSSEALDVRRQDIELAHPTLSIRRQCELVGVNRSTWYYQPVPESAANLRLMRLIDEQDLRTPFYGWPRMTAHLRGLGEVVNHKRVQRLMHKMGIQAVYPKPRTTISAPGHQVDPYLLRGLAITRPNQVWSADITYIPMHRGFLYLMAIIDWFSRYVLTWRVSNTLDDDFCREAVREAFDQSQPEIFNTDQGVQFTAQAFTSLIEGAGVQMSMDGRGRALDNVFVERPSDTCPFKYSQMMKPYWMPCFMVSRLW
ncbi:putative transposase [Candidatus Vecturithrix granuli]|uniref:Putative transposase n=1 Tax=Vecturithrix granuli TaxID=1499967 RepID=A0A081BUV3_VECG1|nr:putative transposase [Candidatus Vecturithrix granuli]